MAAAAESLTRHSPSLMAKIVDFSPKSVKAPFFLRVAALCVDYMLLLGVPVVWLILAKVLGDGGLVSIGPTAWILTAVVFLINSLLLPLLTGRSLGKMLTGTTIVRTDGTDVDLLHLVLRITVGYAATVVTLGIGFLIAAVNPSGRTLHDIIGGTVVVRARKTLV
jgi:uncharacterized RDD family membrane protein YckC